MFIQRDRETYRRETYRVTERHTYIQTADRHADRVTERLNRLQSWYTTFTRINTLPYPFGSITESKIRWWGLCVLDKYELHR